MAGEVQLKIKSEADLKGVKKAEDALKNLGRAADQAGKKTEAATKKSEGAFQTLGKGIEKVSSTVGKLGAVVAGFGIVGIIMNAVAAVKSLYEWFEKTRTASARLAHEMRTEAIRKSIEGTAKEFERLNEQMAKSLNYSRQMDELDAKKRNAAYAVEDAKLDAAEERELASVAGDEDAAEKQTLIRNKYAQIRSDRNLARTQKEREISYDNAMYEADSMTRNADEFEASAAEDQKNIEALNWQIMRERDPDKKKALIEQRDKLAETRNNKRKSARQMREEADYSREVAEVDFGGTDEAARLRAEAERTRLNSSSEQARASIATNRAERAAKAQAEADKQAKAANALAADQAAAGTLAGQIAAAEAALPGMQANYKRQVNESWNARKSGADAETVAREAQDVQESLGALNAAVEALAAMKKELAALNKKIAAAASRNSVQADEMPTGE